MFDAKYRMNPAEVGTSYHNAYKKPGPEEDDINTMHRYRDAIVHIDGAKQEYERSMFGAYILFPYPNEDEFEEHHFYKSISKVNVGAIPFLPNSTRIMEQFLDEIILDSPEKAYERSTRPLGTKEYYDNKFGGKNVLVGCMSREEQLKVAIDHKFYHTPLKNITDHRLLTQLEYVALYQSIKFFGKKGEAGVTKYGKITNWKVVKRGEITEMESKHNSPDELYIVFEIEDWLDRQERIVPGGHGVKSIVYTSKYMFDRAQEIAELKLETEEQLQEWREKRRRGKIKVQLDHEFVDLAGSVVSIGYSDE